jgi:hypothetical protein
MKKPSEQELETMQDARTASLIRRWLAGKKLTDDEKIEVHQRADIPLDVLSAGPSSPGAKEAVSKLKSTRKHAKYPKKLPEYAAVFGQTDRTIKRWVKRGKETGELPPLDHPPYMAAWWRRNMDNQVPDYLLGFVTAPDPLASPGDGRSRVANSGESNSGQMRDVSHIKSLGMEENVEGLRTTLAIAKNDLDEALRSNDPNVVALRQNNYGKIFNQYRLAELSLIDFREKIGNLVDQEKVRMELAQVFESLRLMRETMPARIVIELEKIIGQSGSDRRAQRILRVLEKYLRPAIEKTRADEENIFRNLQTLDGPEAVKKLLAA